VPVERYRDESAAELLKRLTTRSCCGGSRRTRDHRDLPDKVEMKVFCNITREQASLYQAVLDDMLAKIDSAAEDIERRGLVLATMMKLKQVLNHPAQLLRDGSGWRAARASWRGWRRSSRRRWRRDRALLFTQFAEMGELLRGHLRERLGREVPFLHGGTTKRARDEMVAWFQSPSGPPVLVLSLKAGARAEPDGANHVVHYDRCGTRRWRTRRRTGRSGSGSAAASRCASSCAWERWRSASTG